MVLNFVGSVLDSRLILLRASVQCDVVVAETKTVAPFGSQWFMRMGSVNYNVYYFIRHAKHFFILYFNLVMTCTIIEKLFTFKFDMCLGGHWEKKKV